MLSLGLKWPTSLGHGLAASCGEDVVAGEFGSLPCFVRLIAAVARSYAWKIDSLRRMMSQYYFRQQCTCRLLAFSNTFDISAEAILYFAPKPSLAT